MYNCNTDSLGLILGVEVFFSEGHCSGALWFCIYLPNLQKKLSIEKINRRNNSKLICKLKFCPCFALTHVKSVSIHCFPQCKVWAPCRSRRGGPLVLTVQPGALSWLVTSRDMVRTWSGSSYWSHNRTCKYTLHCNSPPAPEQCPSYLHTPSF